MKNIIFVRDLSDDSGVVKLKEALKETRIEFEVNLANKCVVIEGGNDLVYTAKTVIREAGFTIE